MKTVRAIKVRPSPKHQNEFTDLVEGLGASGYDFCLQAGQTEVSLVFKGSMWILVLKNDGTWYME